MLSPLPRLCKLINYYRNIYPRKNVIVNVYVPCIGNICAVLLLGYSIWNNLEHVSENEPWSTEDFNWHFIIIIFHFSTCVLLSRYNFPHKQTETKKKKKLSAFLFSVLSIDIILLGLNCCVTRRIWLAQWFAFIVNLEWICGINYL